MIVEELIEDWDLDFDTIYTDEDFDEDDELELWQE